jgi:DNA ligase 1
MTKNCEQIISELAANNSRLAKEAIVAQAMDEENQEFFQGVRMAYDNLITFGIKQVPQHHGQEGPGLSWDQFLTLCNQLQTRQLTGNAARDAVNVAMSQSTITQWNGWYRLILTKDLRCGTSDTIVNNVAKNKNRPEFAVPVFECQLAKDGTKHPKKISGQKILEYKLDGTRCLTVIDIENKTVQQFSRNGHLLENFTHVTRSLLTHIDKFDQSCVLDGEIMSESFQKLMTQLLRKSNIDADNSTLYVFDIIPLVEFRRGISTNPQWVRTRQVQQLKTIFDLTDCVKIPVIQPVDLDSAVGQIQFEQFNTTAIEFGFEGIMLKDPNAPYECKRGTNWLKIKPSITVDLTIVSLEEGTGKYQNMLGAIQCAGQDDGRDIQVSVGSGLSDEQRAEWWLDQESLIGQVIEVRADAVTQNQDGTYSLRFPRFVRFRGFVAGQKI